MYTPLANHIHICIYQKIRHRLGLSVKDFYIQNQRLSATLARLSYDNGIVCVSKKKNFP